MVRRSIHIQKTYFQKQSTIFYSAMIRNENPNGEEMYEMIIMEDQIEDLVMAGFITWTK